MMVCTALTTSALAQSYDRLAEGASWRQGLINTYERLDAEQDFERGWALHGRHLNIENALDRLIY